MVSKRQPSIHIVPKAGISPHVVFTGHTAAPHASGRLLAVLSQPCTAVYFFAGAFVSFPFSEKVARCTALFCFRATAGTNRRKRRTVASEGPMWLIQSRTASHASHATRCKVLVCDIRCSRFSHSLHLPHGAHDGFHWCWRRTAAAGATTAAIADVCS